MTKTLCEIFAQEEQMTWKPITVKLPPAMHAALLRESGGDVAQFVRQALSERLGVEYQEKLPGLASATPATRRRVSAAGVQGRARDS